jgi:hypothetical protein
MNVHSVKPTTEVVPSYRKNRFIPIHQPQVNSYLTPKNAVPPSARVGAADLKGGIGHFEFTKILYQKEPCQLSVIRPEFFFESQKVCG